MTDFREDHLPIVETHFLTGHSADEKARLSGALGRAFDSISSDKDLEATVILQEKSNTQASHESIVRQFLDALEERDLDSANRFLGDGFQMVFPGTAPMRRLDELVAWARPRYNYVKKDIATVEVSPTSDGAVVYVIGTLFGEWPNGTSFADIRFIDRFEIEKHLIVRQDVWNDIAEVRPS